MVYHRASFSVATATQKVPTNCIIGRGYIFRYQYSVNTLDHTEPIITMATDGSSSRYPAKYSLQNDIHVDDYDSNNNEEERNNMIKYGPISTAEHSLYPRLPQQELRKRAGGKSSLSLPHHPTSTTVDTSTRPTSSSSAVRLSLLYPLLQDLPMDISVDEIFQQTNIVTTMHHRPRPPQLPIVSHHQETTTMYDGDNNNKPDGQCRSLSHHDVDDDNDENDRRDHHQYFYSNEYHPEYSPLDDTDAEEEAYRHQTNPLLHNGRFDRNDNATTDIDAAYLEGYGMPQHLFPYPRADHSVSGRNDEPNDFDTTNITTATYYDDILLEEMYHHRTHGEIVPVSIPELDETSGHSSSHHTDTITPIYERNMDGNLYYDDDVTNHRINSRYMEMQSPTKIKTGSNQQPHIPTIEISPGKNVPLRGAKETMYAIQCGFYVTIPCTICTQSLICIANCEMVLCPTCRIVSPNTTRTLKHTTVAVLHPTNTTTRRIMNIENGIDDDDDDDEIIVRLDVKSGVGLGLQAT